MSAECAAPTRSAGWPSSRVPDARIAAQMDAIRQLIEWIADDSAGFVATVLPYGPLGLGALYVAWLVIGSLRVSQVGINAESVVQPTPRLPRAPDGAIEAA